MRCDISGKEGARYRIRLEGAVLNVSEEFKHMGELIGEIQEAAPEPVRSFKPQPKETAEEMVVGDIAVQIKNKREQLKLTQEELANQLNEKTSVIHSIESGHLTPPIILAQKIGKYMGLTLTELYKETHETGQHQKTEDFTLGDFIKTKKKKT